MRTGCREIYRLFACSPIVSCTPRHFYM